MDEKKQPQLYAEDVGGNGYSKDYNGGGAIPPQLRKLHDTNITFEEYHYYALQTREEEKAIPPAKAGKNPLAWLIPNLQKQQQDQPDAPTVNVSDENKRGSISENEWTNASRAVRTATAGAIFYLITTDILGPFGLPYAFGTTGWGPGFGLFTAFGLMAGVSGWLLWSCFMGLDSHQFPVKSYGDIAFRLYGHWARYMMNILQSVQLLCNVAVIIISNGQALSEVSKFKLCYAVCCLVWALCGFILGQIRTLQKFGWLANVAVFINLALMFITMGAAANSDPLFSAGTATAGYAVNPALVAQAKDGSYPPVQHSVGLPNPSDFSGAINGLMSAVYAYGGAMIFPEFMSEMKRPRDFLKGMWGAQLFIYICYMFYGLFIYGYQGQYVTNPSYLGISGYGLQTAGNVLAMVSALIAAALYGNIGLKVLYNNIAIEFFRAPPLNHRTGKILWVGLIPLYWAVAYIIGAAIPAFPGFTSVVAASCILQFTYTFPPFLHVAYNIKKNAIRSDEGFNPETGEVVRHDRGFSRLMRGFWAKQWYLNVWNILYCMGSLATAGLGIWAAVKLLIAIYSVPQLNAYGCTSPLDAGT